MQGVFFRINLIRHNKKNIYLYIEKLCFVERLKDNIKNKYLGAEAK